MTQATELRELATLLKVDSGNVGIGIAGLSGNPAYTLTLGQANVAGAKSILLAGSGNPKHEILFREASLNYGFTLRYSGDLTNNIFDIVAHENSADGVSAIAIKRDGGNVGIGTIDPQYGLHVKGAGDIKIEDDAGGSAHLRIGASTSSLRNSEWKVKVSGSLDEFHIDHDYTDNDGSNDVAVGTNVFKLTSDDNVEIANDVLTNNAKLKAIVKDLSNDASGEVFVYDTRKDSDGGAWRHRTQNTSWYNETLNTATRGARKEFPAVAIITADITEGVRIYDADDPDMPMWMRFQRGKSGITGSNDNNYITSVTALNGTMVVGYGGGMGYFNFLNEYIERAHSSNTGNTGGMPFNIAERNETGSGKGLSLTMAIKNAWVNDVAMTVLPNAPIDLTTGLPVPTIAVATNGGVSVIKDDGSVVDITQSTIYDTVREIDFTYDNKIIYTMDNAASRSARVDSIPNADFVVTSNQLSKGSGEEFYTGKDFGYSVGDLAINLPTGSGNNINKVIGSSPNCREISMPQGINRIALEGPDSPDKGLISYIASDYNTGWMVGDSKLATLSDTDTTNAVGTDLATNGTFASDSNWEKSSHWTISSGVATMPSTSSYLPLYQVGIGFVVGKTYTASIEVTAVTGQLKFGVIASTGGGLGSVASQHILITTTGTHTVTFIATSVHDGIGISRNTAASCTVDNISVRLAERDRSYNNNGFQVFGTITKTAVATGAELVSYSGFTDNNTNGLVQPYNEDVVFGTGDFTVMGWLKKTDTGTNDYAISWTASSASVGGNPRWGIRANEGTQTIAWNVNGSIIVDTGIVTSGYWQQVCFVRKSGVISGYVNGKLENSATNSTNFTSSGSNSLLRIGNWTTGSYAFVGELALWRISKTAATVEQIKKMYNDESSLFATNAKATLYGTTDAVTALSYDDDTELLHAGTSVRTFSISRTK